MNQCIINQVFPEWLTRGYNKLCMYNVYVYFVSIVLGTVEHFWEDLLHTIKEEKL